MVGKEADGKDWTTLEVGQEAGSEGGNPLEVRQEVRGWKWKTRIWWLKCRAEHGTCDMAAELETGDRAAGLEASDRIADR